MYASSRELAPSAVAGRIAFVSSSALLAYGAFGHPPRLFASPHVAHFAAFYLFSVACASAAKRLPVLTLGCYVAAVAVAVEVARALVWLPADTGWLDWIGDMAGVAGALAPMLLQKIRSRFDGAGPA